jgi:UDP-N-acetylglucosamine--dolichyl-phosphate N-acetylglucosaminephosphotransferase
MGYIVCYLGGIPIVCHWFLLPQLINFLYSIPQLFGFYECPRHRLTTYNIETNRLHAIRTNMNLLNLSLRILGPTNEGVLCFKLLCFQLVCSCIPIAYLLLAHLHS